MRWADLPTAKQTRLVKAFPFGGIWPAGKLQNAMEEDIPGQAQISVRSWNLSLTGSIQGLHGLLTREAQSFEGGAETDCNTCDFLLTGIFLQHRNKDQPVKQIFLWGEKHQKI